MKKAEPQHNYNVVVRGVDPDNTTSEFSETLSRDSLNHKSLNRIVNPQGYPTYMIRVFFGNREDTEQVLKERCLLLRKKIPFRGP